MRKSVTAHPIKRVSIWILLLGLLYLLFSPLRVNSEGPPDNFMTNTSVMRIDGKTSDSVIVSERHFMVRPSTIILGPHGREVPFVLLRLPCEAEITYRLRMDENPECLKIKFKRRLRDPGRPLRPSTPEG
jgi:hypothetical protein